MGAAVRPAAQRSGASAAHKPASSLFTVLRAPASGQARQTEFHAPPAASTAQQAARTVLLQAAKAQPLPSVNQPPAESKATRPFSSGYTSTALYKAPARSQGSSSGRAAPVARIIVLGQGGKRGRGDAEAVDRGPRKRPAAWRHEAFNHYDDGAGLWVRLQLVFTHSVVQGLTQ